MGYELRLEPWEPGIEWLEHPRPADKPFHLCAFICVHDGPSGKFLLWPGSAMEEVEFLSAGVGLGPQSS